MPAGGVSAFPGVRGIGDVTEICVALEDRGVLVVPGFCFDHPDRMRIGFGGDTAELSAGLLAITQALNDLTE